MSKSIESRIKHWKVDIYIEERDGLFITEFELKKEGVMRFGKISPCRMNKRELNRELKYCMKKAKEKVREE